ncbi:non-ribosomal peptide synthetase [Vibrio sp.]|nr:non-ribosomal peptide synthetase [Vibrio sp.]
MIKRTHFFNDLVAFGDSVAVQDLVHNQVITYHELGLRVQELVQHWAGSKKLIFLEASQSIDSIVYYLAALNGGHVIHLMDTLHSEQSRLLIDNYTPNLIITGEGDVQNNNSQVLDLVPNLGLLLATSGSTGVPKFVKLSYENIASNAESIAEYLELTASEKAMCHLKLNYSYGISIINSHLAVGATIILTERSVTEADFWSQFNDCRATSFAGVPYTFESLNRMQFSLSDYPTLRYVTQAGGKLEKSLVQQFAQDCQANNARFYVMYGQTEAAPRISYLPPDKVFDYPQTIGVAIPGGELSVLDDNGHPILKPDVAGELCYRGPNVMLGYAENIDELKTDETPEALKTGDIGCFNKDGMFYIVGRSKRFVKLFGLRINLDGIQSFVKEFYPSSAVAGDDNGVVVAIEGKLSSKKEEKLINALSNEYKVPDSVFSILYYDELPLMTSGKYNFKAIMADVKDIQKPTLFDKFKQKVINILELEVSQWDSILELYQDVLKDDEIEDIQTFNELNADSLSFVTLSVELEQLLGDKLPADWQDKSIAEMNTLFKQVQLS